MRKETKNRIYEGLSYEQKVKMIQAVAKEYQRADISRCQLRMDESGVTIVACKNSTLNYLNYIFERLPSFCDIYMTGRYGEMALRLYIWNELIKW